MSPVLVVFGVWAFLLLTAWTICADSKRRETESPEPPRFRGPAPDLKEWKLTLPPSVPIPQPKVVVEDVPGPAGEMLARLLEEALLAGTIKPGDAIYWESRPHPSGVNVPIRIVPAAEIEAMVAAEAEDYLTNREPGR